MPLKPEVIVSIRPLVWAIIFSSLCLCARPLPAQVSAVLSGRVTDPTGAAVQGATLTASSDDTGIARSTVTNQYGMYDLMALPIGHYQLSAKKAGFAEQVRTGIVLVVGQDATVDLSLKVGEVTEQVKVEGDAELVNPTSQDSPASSAKRKLRHSRSMVAATICCSRSIPAS